MAEPRFKTIRMLSGTSLSDGLDLHNAIDDTGAPLSVNQSLAGIIMPASWDKGLLQSQAKMTFQISTDGVTWYDLWDSFETEITFLVKEGKAIRFDPYTFMEFPRVRVRSGTASSPITQSADRDLTMVLRRG